MPVKMSNVKDYWWKSVSLLALEHSDSGIPGWKSLVNDYYTFSAETSMFENLEFYRPNTYRPSRTLPLIPWISFCSFFISSNFQIYIEKQEVA